ncbi:MAG: hypothetical protein IBJ00_06570 [Alphaproteobacteria bacterium]|nr:hypothetical protein [Alphaproteobacteria bacterium]
MANRETYLQELKDKLGNYADDLSALKQDIRYKTSGDFAKAFETAQAALKDASKAYESLKSAAEEDWDDLVKSTAKAFNNVSKTFKDMSQWGLERLYEAPRQLQHQLEDCIKENPLTSVLAALGIGIILGKIMK